jgi:hypothetical protein
MKMSWFLHLFAISAAAFLVAFCIAILRLVGGL